MTWTEFGTIVTRINFLKFTLWKKCFSWAKNRFYLLIFMHIRKRRGRLFMVVRRRIILFFVERFLFCCGKILMNSITFSVVFQHPTNWKKEQQGCLFFESSTFSSVIRCRILFVGHWRLRLTLLLPIIFR